MILDIANCVTYPLVVTPIVCWLFLPLYFRLKLTSCYEYLKL